MIKKRKEILAMLLAGGQGSRLGVLTKNIAKPAVPFGGKYRIIDFSLSNCVNSGIDTVGVLTQYQPLELNSYIGNGRTWGLDRNHGGVHILPPYHKAEGASWYKGTANAIYQNINFIENYDPEYVIVLSGDHIYKMDYSKMLAFHKKKNADCTIAVMNVPIDEASRFGIMNADNDNKIYEFEEKPEHPKSTNASMGVYIFRWDKLKKYLILDEQNQNSSNDFGKNVLPLMLESGENMYAYQFDGYWKDVGTISSLWEANMDLINPKIPMELDDNNFKIYAKSCAYIPHYAAPSSKIVNSMICEGCEIAGEIDFSIISGGAAISENAVIRDSVIMPGAVIEEGSIIQYAIIGENAHIGKNCKIGKRPEECENKDEWGICTIGGGINISNGSLIHPKEMIDHDI